MTAHSGSVGDLRLFTYIYAGDQRIAMIDKDGKLHFYLNDHLGSARMVIDTAGTVKDNYDYYAFGGAHSQAISTGQSYRYTGKPFDNDRGLNLQRTHQVEQRQVKRYQDEGDEYAQQDNDHGFDE